MNNQGMGIVLQECWSFLEEGITKLQNHLEWVPEQQLNPDLYMKLYSTIYNMCGQWPPHNYDDQFYNKYKDFLDKYINRTVLPALREKHHEFILIELVKRWDTYQIFGRWLSHLFNRLNQYFIPRNKLPSLAEVNLKCFRDQVYAEIKGNVKDAVVTLIDREREGEKIDRILLKNILEIFLVMDGAMDAYKFEFELEILTHTATYYSRKAASWIEDNSSPEYMLQVEECLEREKERVRNYMHASSEPELLKIVQHELLTPFVNQLLSNVDSGCDALLREGKVEDLSRMYRFISTIPIGMELFAAMFRQHVTDEGITLVEQAEVTRGKRKAGNKESQGVQEEDFVIEVIKLHEKYLQYVSQCFDNHLLFQKAIVEAFEVLSNKGVAGTTSPELLVTFCHKILTKGCSERLLSDEAIEDTLQKVVKLLAYISDKDLFLELYRKMLARRLLDGESSNHDQERSMVTRVKQHCGSQLISKMEGMLTDITLSRAIHTSFEKYLIENSALNRETDLTVTVLNTGYWPSYKSPDLAMPDEMAKCVEVFEEFYQTETKQQKLTWIFSLGRCTVTGNFDPKPIDLTVTTCQASVLLIFNEGDRLSYADIKQRLNLADGDIQRVLHSLSCAKYKILNKDPSTNIVDKEDFFEYNLKFTDKLDLITIPVPVPAMDEKRKAFQAADTGRRYVIDASLVRIMKSRKVLSHQQLVAECVEQLGQMFKPDVKIIKEQIEDLIGREFLERDKDDSNTFRYLA